MKMTIPGFVLPFILLMNTACSSHYPVSKKLMSEHDARSKVLSTEWDKGTELVTEGDNKVKRGEELIAKGENLNK